MMSQPTVHTPNPTTRGRLDWRLLAGVVVLGAVVATILVRVAPGWREAVEPGGVLVRDPDAAYHLRRAERMLEPAPNLAVHDPFLNFPAGGWVIWPPLYDLGLALAHRALPPGVPGFVSLPVALTPVAWWLATCAVVWWWARRLAGPGLGAWVALVTALLLPASIPYTRLALIDHHAAELWAWTACPWVVAQALRPAAGRFWLWAGALAVGVALLLQLTLVAIVPLLILGLLVCRTSRGWFELAAIFGGAVLVVGPFAWRYHLAGAPVAYHQFGWVQWGLLGAAALGALAAGAALSWWHERRPQRWMIATCAGLAALALGVWLWPHLVGASQFVGARASAWAQSIAESRSVLTMEPAPAARELHRGLSVLVLAVPVFVVWTALRRRSIEWSMAAALCVVGGILALAQVRYQAHLVPGVALASGILATRLGAAGGARCLGVAVVVLLSLAAPHAHRLGPERTELAFAAARPVLDSLRVWAPANAGRQGVLAPWAYGHFIQHHGRWPAVVDNFGEHAGDLSRPRRFFLAEDEDLALALLDDWRVRYVLVGDWVETFASLLPSPTERSRVVAAARLDPSGKGTVTLTDAGARTMLGRLALFAGGVGQRLADGRFTPPCTALRLVAEGRDAGGEIEVQLFERVQGARVRVDKRRPGESGAIFATIDCPTGRRIPWVAEGRADGAGRFELRFPYPVGDGPYAAQGEVRFRDGAYALPAADAELARDGRVLRVTPPAAVGSVTPGGGG